MVYSFEKRKRAQELQAAKHLDLGSDNDEGRSGSSSESETEDEDAEMLTTALDLKARRKRGAIRCTLYILDRYSDTAVVEVCVECHVGFYYGCETVVVLRVFYVFAKELFIAHYPARVCRRLR